MYGANLGATYCHSCIRSALLERQTIVWSPLRPLLIHVRTTKRKQGEGRTTFWSNLTDRLTMSTRMTPMEVTTTLFLVSDFLSPFDIWKQVQAIDNWIEGRRKIQLTYQNCSRTCWTVFYNFHNSLSQKIILNLFFWSLDEKWGNFSPKRLVLLPHLVFCSCFGDSLLPTRSETVTHRKVLLLRVAQNGSPVTGKERKRKGNESEGMTVGT